MTNKDYFISTEQHIKQLKSLQQPTMFAEVFEKYNNIFNRAIEDAIVLFRFIYAKAIDSYTEYKYSNNKLLSPLDNETPNARRCLIFHAEKIAIIKENYYYIAKLIVSDSISIGNEFYLSDIPKDHPYYAYNMKFDHIEFAMVAYYLTCYNLWFDNASFIQYS